MGRSFGLSASLGRGVIWGSLDRPQRQAEHRSYSRLLRLSMDGTVPRVWMGVLARLSRSRRNEPSQRLAVDGRELIDLKKIEASLTRLRLRDERLISTKPSA